MSEVVYRPVNQSTPESDLLTLLVGKGVISERQADAARQRTRREKISFHQALMDLNVCGQEEIFQGLSQVTGFPFVRLSQIEISEEAMASVSAKVAMHYQFIPLDLKRGSLTSAFANPPSLHDLENLRLLLGFRIVPQLATPLEVKARLKSVYGLGAETMIQIREERGSKSLRAGGELYESPESDLLGDEGREAAPIIRLVNQIILEAVRMNATDIHIEPFKNSLKLRYRIDGMLRDIPLPKDMLALREAIISRIKVMADLDIAERRLPHDGRLRVSVGEESFDLRVSIMPTRFGETICLRILNRSSIFLKMPELGLNERDGGIMDRLIELPHGIILVTGPTGSGKTTTLYAALAQVRDNNPERKIITVEDPIEYELERVSQVQIRSRIGLTFAQGLRSILRHDPDIVLVGEIRDEETAEIAIRASLTGHLVFSTLHTNDSVSSVNRLVDMGVEPYLAASSLSACLAQRLVRRICRRCKTPETNISPGLRNEIGEFLELEPNQVQAWRGEGCPECDHTGYRGRVAIYEFFLVDDEIRDMISARVNTSELRRRGIARGMNTLRQDGWKKVSEGSTTVEEVNRITGNFRIGYEMGAQ